MLEKSLLNSSKNGVVMEIVQFNFGSIGALFSKKKWKLHTHSATENELKNVLYNVQIVTHPHETIRIQFFPFTFFFTCSLNYRWICIYYIQKYETLECYSYVLVALFHFAWIIYSSEHSNDIFDCVSIGVLGS